MTGVLLRSAKVAPPRGTPSRPAGQTPSTSAASVPAGIGTAGIGTAGIRTTGTVTAGGLAAGPAGTTPSLGGMPGGLGRAGADSTGTGSISASSLIRRVPAGLFERARSQLRGGHQSAQQPTEQGHAGDVIRRENDFMGGSFAPTGLSGGGRESGGAPQQFSVHESLTSREWDELVDEVVRRLETKVTDELARRGRLFTPRAF